MKTLAELAIKYKSDKHGHHDYCNTYEQYFAPLKNEVFTFIELGIGGYEYPDRGGAGLKMWYDYFPNARIVGVDKFIKKGLSNDRTAIYQGSQADPQLFNGIDGIIDIEGRPRIVIDDASHMNGLTIQSFELLFPQLQDGGIYVVEDIESSWWEEHDFDGCRNREDMHAPTTINYFRKLLNEVSSKYNGEPEKFGIKSVHFYSNLIIILKKQTP